MHVRPVPCLIAVFAALSVGVAPGASAAAPGVFCGQTVTADAALASDLACAVGVTLQGDVTLDLRHHTLSSVDGAGTGVLVHGGSATVRNGSLVGWGTAVGSESGAVSLTSLTLSGNRTGVDFESDKLTADRLAVSGSSLAVADFSSGTVTVTDSQFSQNNEVFGSPGDGNLAVSASSFTGNGTVLSASEMVAVAFDRDHLIGNTIGIHGFEVSNLSVTNSLLSDNGVAIYSYYEDDNDLISGNELKHNTVGLEFGGAVTGTASDNVFTANASGVLVDPDLGFDLDVALKANIVTKGGDGIVADFPGLTLQGNVVTKNSGHGIYTPQANDLGGNVAYKNGISPQCVGVVCTSS